MGIRSSSGIGYWFGTFADDFNAGRDTNELILGFRGNDTLAGGAGSDIVKGGFGDDSLIYDAELNASYFDIYHGGRGNDSLTISMTAETWTSEDLQKDLARYNAKSDSFDPGFGFKFASLGLRIKKIEDVEFLVDGVALTPQDDPVIANDDSETIEVGDGPATFDVLANDSVPDLVASVILIDDAGGRATLDAENQVVFDTTGLAGGESFVVTYEVRDADGDSDIAALAVDVAPPPPTFYFFAEFGNGRGIYKSNGTEAGTEFVVDPNGGTGAGLEQLTPFKNGFLFSASTTTEGTEPWFTDGTEAGTNIVRDIVPDAGRSFPNNYAVLGDRAFFTAEESATGVELYVTDGSEGGTVLFADLNPDASSSFPSRLTPVGDQLFFIASTPDEGSELWRTDGTMGGTRLVKDINDGPGNSILAPLKGLDGKLLFSVGSRPSDLWISDGTEAGTIELTEGIISRPDSVEIFEGLAYFARGDGAGGFDLWRTNGTVDGTELVADLGMNNFSLLDMAVVGDELFFQANQRSDGGFELWKTNGEPGGTELVESINAGGSDTLTSGTQFEVAEDKLVFRVNDGIHGDELWVSDGTADGTELLKDINPGPDGSRIAELTAVGDKVVFRAFTPTEGQELWITDGTTDGTTIVADIVPGSGSSTPFDFEILA